jgi:hypothetical protein
MATELPTLLLHPLPPFSRLYPKSLPAPLDIAGIIKKLILIFGRMKISVIFASLKTICTKPIARKRKNRSGSSVG